jgi:hypothetical protein
MKQKKEGPLGARKKIKCRLAFRAGDGKEKQRKIGRCQRKR